MKTTWKDIIMIKGKYYGIEKEISGKPDNGIYNCDNFFSSLEKEFNVDHDDIKTLMFDNIHIPHKEILKIGYGEESCGVYIDGVLQYV